MSRYVDISHFRAPYKNAVLQGFGMFAPKKRVLITGPYRSFPWAQLASQALWVGQQQVVGNKWSGNKLLGEILSISSRPTDFAHNNFSYAPTMAWLKSRVSMGSRVYVNVGDDEIRVAVSHTPGDSKWMLGSSLATPEGKLRPWQDVTSTLASSGSLQGFGAAPVQVWYYDENPAGKVRCFVPAAAQVAFKTLDNMNPAVSGPDPVHPTHVVWAIPQPQTVPGMDFATLVALPSEMPAPVGGQPAGQWLRAHTGSVVAWFSKTPGAPLDISVDGLKSGAYGLMASSSPQMIAGEGQPLPSAVFAGYDPVLPKPAPGGGGGGEEPAKAGISPLGIATIAVVVGAIGYLALKKPARTVAHTNSGAQKKTLSNGWTLTWSPARPNTVYVDDDRNGSWSDSAIRYSDGRIAYDAPERIPQKVKSAVRSMFRKVRG